MKTVQKITCIIIALTISSFAFAEESPASQSLQPNTKKYGIGASFVRLSVTETTAASEEYTYTVSGPAISVLQYYPLGEKLGFSYTMHVGATIFTQYIETIGASTTTSNYQLSDFEFLPAFVNVNALLSYPVLQQEKISLSLGAGAEFGVISQTLVSGDPMMVMFLGLAAEARSYYQMSDNLILTGGANIGLPLYSVGMDPDNSISGLDFGIFAGAVFNLN